MNKNKRYYWLKLKTDFFDDIRIKKIRKIAGGDTYTIIYLKMLLISLKTNGILIFQNVENDFAKELALIIDEDETNISVTLQFLLSQGLLEIIDENQTEYFLTKVPELVGSETASTIRSRKSRELKALQCNTSATSCNKIASTEREIESEREEKREKREEKREERESKKIASDFALTHSDFMGKYQNVILSAEEFSDLSHILGNFMGIMIDRLSVYLKTTNKSYSSHYAVILDWWEQDKAKIVREHQRKSKQITHSEEDDESI